MSDEDTSEGPAGFVTGILLGGLLAFFITLLACESRWCIRCATCHTSKPKPTTEWVCPDCIKKVHELEKKEEVK